MYQTHHDVAAGEISVSFKPVLPSTLQISPSRRILPLATCATRYRAEIPGVELRVLPGVGHLPMWDNTRLLTDTIAEWVSRHTAVSPATA